MDFGNRREIIGRFLFAGILAVVIGALLTAVFYDYWLRDNLFGSLLVLPMVGIRTCTLFIVICPLVFLFSVKLPWSGRLGLFLVAVYGAYLFQKTMQEDYRGWRNHRHQEQVEREASEIFDDLWYRDISRYKDRVGSRALSLALERLLQLNLRPDQLHEVVRWYVADDSAMVIVSGNPLVPSRDLGSIYDFYQDPNNQKTVNQRQLWREILFNLARNKQTPAEVLAKFLDTPWSADAARNPACPRAERQLWLERGSSGDEDDRVRVAANVYASPALLTKMASDPAEAVRRQVAGNASCLPVLLQKLAMDPSGQVRFMVAKNQSSPTPLLKRLAQDDPERFVRQQAESTLWDKQERKESLQR